MKKTYHVKGFTIITEVIPDPSYTLRHLGYTAPMPDPARPFVADGELHPAGAPIPPSLPAWRVTGNKHRFWIPANPDGDVMSDYNLFKDHGDTWQMMRAVATAYVGISEIAGDSIGNLSTHDGWGYIDSRAAELVEIVAQQALNRLPELVRELESILERSKENGIS